jgi:hypothetical protein
MKFNWFKKKTSFVETNLQEIKQEQLFADEFTMNVTFDGLPIIVADDDFTEFLLEEGYGDKIEYDDFVILYEEWAAENVVEFDAFCVKCKEAYPIKNLVIKTSDSGRQMAQGFCSNCEYKVNKILGTRG